MRALAFGRKYLSRARRALRGRTRRATADLVVLAGAAVVDVGLHMVWPPLAFLAGGLALAAFGISLSPRPAKRVEGGEQ